MYFRCAGFKVSQSKIKQKNKSEETSAYGVLPRGEYEHLFCVYNYVAAKFVKYHNFRDLFAEANKLCISRLCRQINPNDSSNLFEYYLRIG